MIGQLSPYPFVFTNPAVLRNDGRLQHDNSMTPPFLAALVNKPDYTCLDTSDFLGATQVHWVHVLVTVEPSAGHTRK